MQEEQREKKQSRLGKINLKLKAIISTITMSSIVTLAQFECVNGMTEWRVIKKDSQN